MSNEIAEEGKETFRGLEINDTSEAFGKHQKFVIDGDDLMERELAIQNNDILKRLMTKVEVIENNQHSLLESVTNEIVKLSPESKQKANRAIESHFDKD